MTCVIKTAKNHFKLQFNFKRNAFYAVLTICSLCHLVLQFNLGSKLHRTKVCNFAFFPDFFQKPTCLYFSWSKVVFYILTGHLAWYQCIFGKMVINHIKLHGFVVLCGCIMTCVIKNAKNTLNCSAVLYSSILNLMQFRP